MASIKFLTKGNNNPTTILLRFIDGRKCDVMISSGFIVDSKYWSNHKSWFLPKAEFDGKKELENSLKKLELYILKKRNEAIENGETISKEWFKDLMQERITETTEETPIYLTDLFDSYINKLPNAVRNGKYGVTKGTINTYKTTKGRLVRYEEFLDRKLTIGEIGFDFHEKYLDFATNNLGLAQNSIGKDIKQFKTVLTDAKDSGLTINEQALSRKFNSPSEKTLFTTLSKSEIDKLMKFNGTESLNNARDWLVIGCWTGCRVGDLMKLNMQNIRKHKGYDIIEHTQHKTNKMVSVPIHPHVEQIISKNNSFPRPISDVKFNLYIKKICKIAGIDELIEGTRQNPITHKKETGMFPKHELIRSHICRRSFATNHYNEISNKVIMAVTGHSTEKMLLNYIGVTEEHHIGDFLENWNIKKK